MKRMTRIVMALMLATALFVSGAVLSSATQGAGAANDIKVPIGSGVLPEERNHSLIDFNSNKIAYGNKGKTMNQTYINYYLDSESADEIWYMDTDLYVGENPVKKPAYDGDYQDMWDMFSSNSRYYAHREVASVGGKGTIDTCLQFHSSSRILRPPLRPITSSTSPSFFSVTYFIC